MSDPSCDRHWECYRHWEAFSGSTIIFHNNHMCLWLSSFQALFDGGAEPHPPPGGSGANYSVWSRHLGQPSFYPVPVSGGPEERLFSPFMNCPGNGNLEETFLSRALI